MDFRLAGLALVLILAGLCRAEELSNKYVSFEVSGPSITRLQAGRKYLRFAEALRPEFWQSTPETRTTKSGSQITVSPLDIWEYWLITPKVPTDKPDRLLPGQTLSQTFNIGSGTTFSSLSVKLPTWHSKDSAATLSLIRDGETITTKRLENVQDNSWQKLTLEEPLGEGTYTVQLSDPKGDIGWWSSNDLKERALQVNAHKRMGTGTLNISLDEKKIKVAAEYHLTGESSYKAFPWRWITTWTMDGYDCTPKARVVFSRFYTDNQRYMPIQQLKRRSHGGLQFDGFKWVEMDGNEDADFRLVGANHLHWEMTPDQMSIRFDTPVEKSGDGWKTEFTLEVKPRDDAIPSEFPHFSCSDKALEADLNRFWWERGFTYPYPPSGSAEWMEWTALTRSWMRNVTQPAAVKHLLDYPITNEGYVHTWGSTIGWPLVPNRDTRHFDTNARFILGCWRHYLWTGDKDFLRKQADRLRLTMNYQLEQLKGKDGLIITPDFKTGRHEDLSNNYWDILPFGHLDAYANAVFYASLEAMAQMEDALPSDIRYPKSDIYRSLAKKSHTRYDEVFWDEKNGRYIGCVDSDGVKHDYGFTFVNLEALYYGLGDADKARRIYHWMETEPTSSGKADTYSAFIFAPRATTIHNPMWGNQVSAPPAPQNLTPNTQNPSSPSPPPWWTYWWPGTPYGEQCQDGGAILYTSFFDLMARARNLGADNAWKRFMEIMDRYRMPDRLCGGSPLFRGEVSQQENAGAVGVDYPFPESGLAPLYFLYGVMGIEATPEGLRITPNLPKALAYAEVKYLNWHGADLKVRVTRETVEVTSADKSFHRKFDIKSGKGVLIK